MSGLRCLIVLAALFPILAATGPQRRLTVKVATQSEGLFPDESRNSSVLSWGRRYLNSILDFGSSTKDSAHVQADKAHLQNTMDFLFHNRNTSTKNSAHDKVHLQNTVDLFVHNTNTGDFSLNFAWNGASASQIQRGGSGRVSVFPTEPEPEATVSQSISNPRETVFSWVTEFRNVPCKISAFNNVFIHPVAQTEAVTESYETSFFVVNRDNTCLYTHNKNLRVFYGNLAQAPGNMFFSDFSTSRDNPGTVKHLEFGKAHWEDGDTNVEGGRTYYTYLHYKEDEDTRKICARCALNFDQNSQGSAYFVWWGRRNNVLIKAVAHGEGILVTCVETDICVEPKKSNNICFHRDSKLRLESGESKPIEDIEIGERIEVIATDNSRKFSPVIFLPHKKNSIPSSFIELHTVNGRILSVTSSHLVFSSTTCDSNASFRLVAAKDIKEGMCLQHVDGADEVRKISTVYSEGVYSVVTEESSGYVLANGFKVSSFGVNHNIVNTYYNIHRVLYHFLPTSVLSSSILEKLNTIIGDIAAYFHG